MQGPPSDPGVNIRALTRLFQVAGERFPDIRYEIRCSLMEVYNEKIQDLLGEKGKVLKAVQGQYGMEVQDLTSEQSKQATCTATADGLAGCLFRLRAATSFFASASASAHPALYAFTSIFVCVLSAWCLYRARRRCWRC